MMRKRLAVIGAGVIGRFHIASMARHPAVELAAIVDPTDAARGLARTLGVPCHASHHDLTPAAIDGAIVATPNATHADITVALLDAGIPVLVEKPIADTLANAEAIAARSFATGVPVLVGHHRRHSPVTRAAKALIDAGGLGRIRSVSILCNQLKHDGYFDIAWHAEAGAGPILINLIHDLDQLIYLCGAIAEVFCLARHDIRNLAVEDSAAVTFAFASGALGVASVSDCTAAPWVWDQAAGESPRFARQDVNAIHIMGTGGALALPTLEYWRYRGERHWHAPITRETTMPLPGDPFVEQLRHFAAMIDGNEAPLCSAADGLASLGVALAIHQSARDGRPIRIPPRAAVPMA